MTVWQIVLRPHIPESRMADLLARLAEAGMPTDATAFAAGAVAYVGKWACKFGLAHTKQNGTAVIRHLETRFTLDAQINIHLTGCPNSCGQHYTGNIGLAGANLSDGGEGYLIVLGGGTDSQEGLASPLAGPIPASGLNTTVEGILGADFDRRDPYKSFPAYVRRLTDDSLADLLDRSVAA